MLASVGVVVVKHSQENDAESGAVVPAAVAEAGTGGAVPVNVHVAAEGGVDCYSRKDHFENVVGKVVQHYGMVAEHPGFVYYDCEGKDCHPRSRIGVEQRQEIGRISLLEFAVNCAEEILVKHFLGDYTPKDVVVGDD